MKKIIALFMLAFLITAVWSQETPDQTMTRLMSLFKQYNITSIPEKISINDFDTLIINKIAKQSRKDFMFSVYEKDSTENNYIIKNDLSEKDTKKIISTLHVAGYHVLTEKQKKENEKTSQAIEKIFNYRALVVGALQDHWNNMSKDQQNDFYVSFKGLIEVIAYPQGSYFYSNSKNTFKKAVIQGDKAIIASDNYNIDKDLDITISYIFKKVNNSWIVVDVEMNNHSLTDAYRLQINRVVEKKGVSGLLADLKKMFNEMKAD